MRVYHDGFIFFLKLSSLPRFWCFALFHSLLVYITLDGLFSSFDVAELLKVVRRTIRRMKHFISMYCCGPYTPLAIHIPLIRYNSSHLLEACELQTLCSKRLSVLFASPVNRKSLSVRHDCMLHSLIFHTPREPASKTTQVLHFTAMLVTVVQRLFVYQLHWFIWRVLRFLS